MNGCIKPLSRRNEASLLVADVRSPPTQFVGVGRRYSRRIVVPLAVLAVFFAVQQTGFGILDYVPLAVTRASQVLLIGATLLLAFLGATQFAHLPLYHRRVVLAFIALNTFYGLGSALFGGVRPIFHLESAILACACVPVIRDSRVWIAILRGFFWAGVVLVALNTVPLLHWAGWVSLPNQFVRRLIDTGVDLSSYDPLSFGIFGRTENQVVVGRFFARLQGWALEPLHWGYFVILTLAAGLILRSLDASRWHSRRYAWAFLLLVSHTFFIGSSSVSLTLFGWMACVAALAVMRGVPWLTRGSGPVVFFTAVIGTGFVIPFALAMIPEIDWWLETEDITGEGSNWRDKIRFLALGPALFTRFVPTFAAEPLTSHNLILEMYLRYGYILVLPLLVFLYWVIRNGISGRPLGFASAILLIVLCHLLLVPTAMFYPAGTLFVIFGLTAAYYQRHGLSTA